MSLDGLVTRAIARELEACAGGRIHKIHQPSEHDVVLQIRAQGRNCKLLLSANPTYPRAHLTEESFVNPMEAPMFCMLLRKHCEGAILEAVSQVGMERVLHFDVRQRDEVGDISVKRVIVELMGRHSNIILMDPNTGTILDGIHHVTPAISMYRIVMPGSQYVAPPEQGKQNPLQIGDRLSFEEALNKVGETEAKQVRQQLVAAFSGLSPLVAKELVYRASASEGSSAGADAASVEPSLDSVWNAFHSSMSAAAVDRYFPQIVDDSKGKSYFSVVELTHLTNAAPQGVRTYGAVSECLEAFYGDKAVRDLTKQRGADLTRFLQNERNKNEKKLDKLQETVEEAKDADKYRIMGELLTSSLHLAKKGMRSIEVVNYYDEEQATITIELDPQLTPSENAQRQFRKYTKSKNSLTVVAEQIRSTEEELVYLNTLLQQLDSAGPGDIDEIREELIEQGYVRDRNKKTRKKKKTPDKPTLTTYTSSEGFPLYVGKNNNQNEYLTNRLAQSNDTWLHTKDIPGSHVVIRGTGFGEPTLHEAAMLAAYYSQAKASSQVPVDYTLIRHVRKPNGAKPGFVIYEQQKTLYVTPDEQAVKQLAMGVRTV
ncbi:Rqc2 family fibronectin-binding protein [Paenibacillus koleovorans]|uniref:Rqc2 family fibronectin-binding protein n=1 Tax=Paenibacillus koleovorans TaxID=121608 RepID=UPI000FD99BDF|nr:NFACT RNA binding domain-containing protein [Paenibacillus koleovorans]